jgi:hypothetical protein
MKLRRTNLSRLDGNARRHLGKYPLGIGRVKASGALVFADGARMRLALGGSRIGSDRSIGHVRAEITPIPTPDRW